jgi:hypothetical protein
VNQRTIEFFQRTAQRICKSGITQRRIDDTQVDTQGTGKSLRATQQPRECGMFGGGQLSDPQNVRLRVQPTLLKSAAQPQAQ